MFILKKGPLGKKQVDKNIKKSNIIESLVSNNMN